MRAATLALLIAPLLPSAQAMWPFKQKRFTAEALYNAGRLGLPEDAGRVVAIGDVNGDQNSDLFVLGKDGKSIHVLIWQRDSFAYMEKDVVDFDNEITNVVPADFNGDGRMDLLVMWTGNSAGGWWGSGKLSTDMVVVMGHPDGLSKGERWEVPSSTYAQPMIFDDDHNLSPALLGFRDTAEGPMLKSWRNTGSAMRVFTPELHPADQVCQFVTPPVGAHSSAFVDMDGDCAPDVVLHCARAKANHRAMQVWLNRGDQGYVLSKTWELPLGSRSISYADMNRNGAMDLVFATCDKHKPSTGMGEKCKLHVAYNHQAGLCDTKDSQFLPNGQLKCRGYEKLCSSDPNFEFLFWEGDDYTAMSMEDLFPGQHLQLMLSVPGHADVPLPIRPGDFDVDGFPDLLITVGDGDKSYVKVLRNVPCSKGVPGCGNQWAKNARGFIVAGGKGWEALEEIEDAVGASWIDLDDDGSLDIMVQRTGKQDKERVTFIQNNFYHDAFFLKGQVLNGACDRRRCIPSDGGKPYSALGVGVSGATFKFTTFDTRGNRNAQKVAQLPQTCYHSLLAPHTLMGLGRTNNYIENLKVGTSLKSDEDRVTSLDGVIPNSQVILNPPWARKPYKNETVLYRSKEWRTELFLHPGDWIPWVAAAVVGTVVTLGMVVVWLGEREKREDEKERRRALHAINFQAL